MNSCGLVGETESGSVHANSENLQHVLWHCLIAEQNTRKTLLALAWSYRCEFTSGVPSPIGALWEEQSSCKAPETLTVTIPFDYKENESKARLLLQFWGYRLTSCDSVSFTLIVFTILMINIRNPPDNFKKIFLFYRACFQFFFSSFHDGKFQVSILQ